MKAKPHPGARKVGGAIPKPGTAMLATRPDAVRIPPALRPALHPVDAAFAAAAWQANKTITRLVAVTYGWSTFARTHGEALAKVIEANVPEGRLRDAATALAGTCIDCADITARAATRFGRHFGHLAFAFPRPG